MIGYYIKQSLRGIKHKRMFTLLNIGGFASGFAICLILALFAYREYNVDKGYPNRKAIFRMVEANVNSSYIDYNVAGELKDGYPGIKSVVPLNYVSLSANPVFLKKLKGEDYILANSMISTTNDFFSAFSIRILAGNPIAPFADLHSVVLSRSAAQRLFGSTDVVGEYINFGNIFELQVSAVSENIPENSSISADIFFNADNEDFRFSRACQNNDCYTPFEIYLILGDPADASRLETLVNTRIPENKSNIKRISLQPFTDIYLHNTVEGSHNKSGSTGMIFIFLSIAALILLLSVTNYVNLTLLMQVSTLRQIGIKITNGASARQLRASSLCEVTISVTLAFLLALVITWLSLPFAGRLLGVPLDIRWLFTPVMAGLFISILLSVILISSLAPIYIISRYDVQQLIGKKGSMSIKRTGKRILTVFQLTSTIALLVGLMVIQKQLRFVKSADIGFNMERLVRIDFGTNFKGQEVLKQQIDQFPFIESLSFSNGTPGNVLMGMSSSDEGGEDYNFECLYVDDQFLKTFGLKLIRGRDFLASDRNNSCLINETAFKKFGWKDLDNRKINNGINQNQGGYDVVGVVKDFNVASLHTGMQAVCLMFKDDYTSLSVRLLPGELNEQLKSLSNAWSAVAPETPMMYTFYDSYFDSFYRKEEKLSQSIAVFSLIALIITCMGLIGQIFQTCQSRIREIGIRKVNGAKIKEVMIMLNKDFVKLVVIAFVFACPVAWYAMHKWLQNFAYKTSLSWWIFALAGVMALGISLLTVSWQSWRAARRNPVEALRYE